MKIKVYVILLLLFSKVSYGNENWTTWTSPPTVLSIAFENNTIWCGTDGDGIIAYNKITGDQQIFTTENGLIDNYVYSIAIDNDGVKWFGTKGGISQYDGYNWVSHPINQESFPYGSKINDIIVDHQNKIWVATSKGIYNFNSTQWETKQSGYFNCIAIDNRGIIWAGDSQFFLRLEGTEAIKIGSDVSAVNVGQVKDIIYDKYKNRIFCAVHKGFVTYDDAAEELTVFPSLTSYQVITTDNNGTIWFGNDEGITSIFEEKTTRFTVNDGLPDNNIKTLAFDNDGILWIGDQRGLSSFDGESFKMHLAPYSSNIASIVIDNENTVWCSHMGETASDNVSYFKKNKWYIGTKGVCKLRSVDEHNVLWGDNSTFLYSYDGSVVKEHHLKLPEPSFDSDYSGVGQISDIYTCNNIVWIAAWSNLSYNGGIYTYDGENVVRISYGECTALSIDSQKNLWVGKDGGLYFYDGTEWYKKNYDDIFHGYLVWDIVIDNNDVVWCITKDSYNIDNSLFCYDGIKFIEYTKENSGLLGTNFYTITTDHNNTKWIGTDAGVCRFDGETCTTFTRSNSGLCDNTVNAIAVEKNNTIWFGTDNGVSRYTGEIITISIDEEDQTPEAISVIKTYPNPFNPSTTIEFTLPESGFATVTIYSLAGQNIRELAADFMPAGTHTLTWDGKDTSGNAVSSGIYITHLQAGKHTDTGRMVLVR